MRSRIAAVALVAALGVRASADDPFLPFQAPDRPDALRYALDFEKYSKVGDWASAVDKLQQLLDLPAGDPVVVRAKGFTPARFEGTGVVARRLFDSLPPDGVAAWELSRIAGVSSAADCACGASRTCAKRRGAIPRRRASARARALAQLDSSAPTSARRSFNSSRSTRPRLRGGVLRVAGCARGRATAGVRAVARRGFCARRPSPASGRSTRSSSACSARSRRATSGRTPSVRRRRTRVRRLGRTAPTRHGPRPSPRTRRQLHDCDTEPFASASTAA